MDTNEQVTERIVSSYGINVGRCYGHVREKPQNSFGRMVFAGMLAAQPIIRPIDVLRVCGIQEPRFYNILAMREVGLPTEPEMLMRLASLLGIDAVELYRQYLLSSSYYSSLGWGCTDREHSREWDRTKRLEWSVESLLDTGTDEEQSHLLGSRSGDIARFAARLYEQPGNRFGRLVVAAMFAPCRAGYRAYTFAGIQRAIGYYPGKMHQWMLKTDTGTATELECVFRLALYLRLDPLVLFEAYLSSRVEYCSASPHGPFTMCSYKEPERALFLPLFRVLWQQLTSVSAEQAEMVRAFTQLWVLFTRLDQEQRRVMLALIGMTVQEQVLGDDLEHTNMPEGVDPLWHVTILSREQVAGWTAAWVLVWECLLHVPEPAQSVQEFLVMWQTFCQVPVEKRGMVIQMVRNPLQFPEEKLPDIDQPARSATRIHGNQGSAEVLRPAHMARRGRKKKKPQSEVV